jgi:hypothetical protein
MKMTKKQLAKLSYGEAEKLAIDDANDVVNTLSVSTGRGVKATAPTLKEIIEAKPEFSDKLVKVWNKIFEAGLKGK